MLTEGPMLTKPRLVVTGMPHPPALGLAPSCQRLGTNDEEAGEKAVPGRVFATLVEAEQPQ